MGAEKFRSSGEKRSPNLGEHLGDFVLGLVFGGDPKEEMKYWGEEVNKLLTPTKRPKTKK